MTLKEMPKVGEKVRYIGKGQRGISYGGIYTLKDFYGYEGAYITDDNGRTREITESRFDMWELVEEGKPVETSQDVIELLANISRRLYEAEQTIKSQAYEINELYKAVSERG